MTKPDNPRATRAPKKRRDWKPAWLAAFEELGTVTAACAAVGIGRRTVYDARQADEGFALAWHDLEEATTERMEAEAYRRAVRGVTRDVRHQGVVVGEEQHYSDTLLIFMLKARKPEMYRENVKVEHAGKLEHDLSAMSDDELREAAAALAAKRAS
jgi:hypothetical protein